jgi:hypothetical protein
MPWFRSFRRGADPQLTHTSIALGTAAVAPSINDHEPMTGFPGLFPGRFR